MVHIIQISESSQAAREERLAANIEANSAELTTAEIEALKPIFEKRLADIISRTGRCLNCEATVWDIVLEIAVIEKRKRLLAELEPLDPVIEDATMVIQDSDIAVVNNQQANLVGELPISEQPQEEELVQPTLTQIDELLTQQKTEFEQTEMIITEEFPAQPQQAGFGGIGLLALLFLASGA